MEAPHRILEGTGRAAEVDAKSVFCKHPVSFMEHHSDMETKEEWIITKYDDFGEPLMREPVKLKTQKQSALERYRSMAESTEEAPF